jgi:hypothetical protein
LTVFSTTPQAKHHGIIKAHPTEVCAEFKVAEAGSRVTDLPELVGVEKMSFGRLR